MLDIVELKLIVLGEVCVGKTSFIKRFTVNDFISDHISTIGIEIFRKTISRGDTKVKLVMFDTIGQERYRSLTRNYYNNTDGVILLYDITNKESFAKIESWLSEIKKAVSSDALMVLVGHKCDLEYKRAIQLEEGCKLAVSNTINFYEASSKTNHRIDEIVNKVVDLAIPLKKMKTQMKKIELVNYNGNQSQSQSKKRNCNC